MLVLHHGVADYHPRRGRQGKQTEVETTAIEHERMIDRPITGNELIHDSAAHSDKQVLRALAQKSQLGSVHRVLVGAKQRKTCSYLDRCRGTQSRTHWNFALNQDVRPRQLLAGLPYLIDDADHVIRPCMSWTQITVQNDGYGFTEGARANIDSRIGPSRYREPGKKVNCRRHHEAVIVVGVLTDEIYATGSSIYLRSPSIDLLELLLKAFDLHRLRSGVRRLVRRKVADAPASIPMRWLQFHPIPGTSDSISTPCECIPS